MNVTIPDGYLRITDYWKGNGPAPSLTRRTGFLLQLTEIIRIGLYCQLRGAEALFGR